MAAGRTAVDAELVLHRKHLDVVDVQKLRRPAVGLDFLLRDFKSHATGIVVARLAVVDRSHDTLRLRILCGNRLADVGREGGNTATARNVIPDKGEVRCAGEISHGLSNSLGRAPHDGGDPDCLGGNGILHENTRTLALLRQKSTFIRVHPRSSLG